MSTYYDFYLARKNAEGKYVLAGNYVFDGEKYVLTSLFSRSGGFMSGFNDIAFWQLSADQLGAAEQEKFVHSYGEGHSYCTAQVLKLSELEAVAELDNRGLRIGYVLKSKLKMIHDHDYKLECWDVELKTSDEVAEMSEKERAKYARTAFVETDSRGYIADCIVKACGTLTYEYYGDIDDFYIICEIH